MPGRNGKVRVLLVGAKFGADLHMGGYARCRDLAEIVASCGRHSEQVQAIADSVKMGLKPFDRPIDMEGVEEGRWIVIDYGDIIVHVFQEEVRALYNLDELWGRAPQLAIPKEFLWETK